MGDPRSPAELEVTPLGAAVVDPASASAGDLADIGFVRAVTAWLPGLRLTGLALILVSIVLALATIRRVIRFQADRVDELAAVARERRATA